MDGGASSVSHETAAIALKSISLVLFITSGVSFNVMLIYAIISNKKFHRPPYYYVVCLCFAELFRTVFCVPFILATVLKHSVWEYGQPVCIMTAFANYFFTFSSTFTLFLLAIDRSVAVLHGHYYPKCFKGVTCLVLAVLAWTSAFLLAFPPVFGLGTYQFVPVEAQCSLKHNHFSVNNTIGYTIIFTVIIVAILILYARLFFFARKHRRMKPLNPTPAISTNWNFFGLGANIPAHNNPVNGFVGFNAAAPANPVVIGFQHPQINPNSGSSSEQQLSEHKNEHLTRMFFTVTIIFDLLWAPYIVTVFWFLIAEDQSDVSTTFVTIATWLTYLQSSITPLVYIVTNKSFRTTLRESLKANVSSTKNDQQTQS